MNNIDLSNRPTYIDIHAHTNFADFDADRDVVVQRALDAHTWMINIGTGQGTSQKAVEMTIQYPKGVYAIVGLHPIHVKDEIFDKNFYKNLILSARASGNKKVVGIGECGLDYFHQHSDEDKKLEDKRRQVEAFCGQIELALELDLPLMLHIRSGEGGNAYRDVLDILAEYKARLIAKGGIAAGDKLRGDAHFFAGTVDDAKEFLALGFHLSYTGVVTFAKQYEELVRATPDDRIMSETDCPYVAPVPNRGQRNEPAFVAHIADTIARLKGADPLKFRTQLVDNAFKLWNINL